MATTLKNITKRNRTGENLRKRGFDESYYIRETGHWRIKCSQCQALVINGIACHERGCPNQPRSRDND